MGLFITCGVLVLWVAVSHLVRHRSAENWLLTLWILGTFVFAAFLNWTCNVRSLLPLAPALGILVARQLQERHGTPSAGPRGPYWALVLTAQIALMVAWADLCLANSERSAAGQVAASLRQQDAAVWFEGHWGFQYYMLAKGGRDLNVDRPRCEPADFVVIPQNNSNIRPIPGVVADRDRVIAIPICPWLATMQLSAGAGFYSSLWGPFPFVFSPVDDQTYEIWRVKFVCPTKQP
jgi:hypothetical protein